MSKVPVIDQAKLDLLRGAANVYVVINHTRATFYGGGVSILAGPLSLFDEVMVGLLQLTALGAEAVILFYVLSNFAMAHSVARSRGAAGFYRRGTRPLSAAQVAAPVDARPE